MLNLFGLFNTDRINRHGFAFTIKDLESYLEQSWRDGSPSFLSHDMHRLLGWSRGVGLLLAPNLAGVVGRMDIVESEQEHEPLRRASEAHLSQAFGAVRPEEQARLRAAIGIPLDGKAVIGRFESICAIDKDLAAARFPQLFGPDQDKDGLVNARDLHPIGPGVFERDGLLLFAHPYLRRSQSRLNNLNAEFLCLLSQMTSDDKFDVKIALDPDMLGLPGTWNRPFELEYWWGPKFTDVLPEIQNGVSCHLADKHLQLYHGISKAEFWWHSRDEKTFEAEEVRDIPSYGLSDDQYACRYVHSILDDSSGLPTHLDGAVRIYDTEHLLDRIDKTIATAGRNTSYYKLWRLDGPLSVSSWKTLIAHYFRDNRLVGEYFDGVDASHADTDFERPKRSRGLAAYVPRYIESDEGIHILISYRDKSETVSVTPVELVLDRWKTRDCHSELGLDFSAIDYLKVLQTRHPQLVPPSACKLLAFEDTDINLPEVIHRGPDAASLAVRTLESLREFVSGLCRRGVDRFISANLAIEGSERVVNYSFAGRVTELAIVMPTLVRLPADRTGVADWCLSTYTLMQRRFPEAKFDADHLELVSPAGVLRARRNPAPVGTMPEKYGGGIGVRVPTDDPALVEALRAGEITAVQVFDIRRSVCDQCQTDYRTCPCRVLLEDAATVTMADYALVGYVWTNRPAGAPRPIVEEAGGSRWVI